MPTIKDRILIATASHRRVKRARDLVIPVGSDEHTITHILWSLQKQGLVTFRLDKRGTIQELQRIQLTPAGQQRAKEITDGR